MSISFTKLQKWGCSLITFELFMSKKTIIIVVVSSLFLVSCKSNYTRIEDKEINYIPYYLEMYKADSLFLINDFNGSYKILDSLFKIYPPLNIDNYVEYGIYLSSAVKSGNLDGIKEKVEFGYKNFGGIMTLHNESYEMYLEVNKIAGLNDDDIKSLKDFYYKSLDIELREKLLGMYEQDQEVRNESNNLSKMDSIDKINRRELDLIFEKYGFPLKSLTGSINAYDLPGGYFRLVTLILHQPEDFKQKYLPILLENVKKGNIEPDVYSMVYDKMLIERKKNQYYGMFYCTQTELCDLENPKRLDSIRKSIGLPHIDYYQWRMKQIN